MMVHAESIACCFSTPCTHAPKQCWLVVTGDSTGLVDAKSGAGCKEGRVEGDRLDCKPCLFAAGLCCSDAGRGSLIMLTLVQSVPVLFP